MVSYLSSVLFALSLLLLTADGRTMQAYLDDINASSSLLDSTYSGTTNYNDVMGLMTLINQFPQLIGVQFPFMTKDPCYPQKLTWIECSNDPIRRVTALYLGISKLYGSLPDFSSMDAIETIDLHQNFLFGPIPAFLGTFPKLTYLNLANNAFTGPLPDSLSNNKKIKLNLSGNPSMCTSSNSCSPPADTQFPLPPIPKGGESQFPLPPIPRGGESQFPSAAGDGSFDFPDTRKRKKSKLPAILGGTIPPSLLITVGGGVFAMRRHRRNAAAAIAAAAVG